MLADELFVERGVVTPCVRFRKEACEGASLIGTDPYGDEIVPFMQVDHDVT